MAPEKKYVTYSKDALEKALALARKGVSIRKAALTFGVPEATVRRKKKQLKVCSAGRPTVLTKEEEKLIIEWIILAAQSGFPVDAKRLKASVGYFCRLTQRSSPFKAGIPGRKWLKLFLRRHPKISRRVPSILSKQRTFVTEKSIRNWFNEVESFIDKQNLRHILEKPECVFNMDESAVRLVPTKEQVFAETGERYVHTSNGNSDKESYTALFAANAAGTLAPPLILFPYKKRLPGEIAKHAPSGWAVGRNQSGWMTRETFLDYLRNVFLPWLKKKGIQLPIIIFVDGHTSHVSYETIEFCRANQIILISLFPNATHILQPLDVSFFRPLKVEWNKHLIEYRTSTAGEPLPKHKIAPLLKEAVDDMKNLTNIIMNGFRKCGLVPWNPNAVNYGMLLKEKDNLVGENSVRDEPDRDQQDEAKSEAKLCLQHLESCLKVGQLKRFEKHESELTWPGPVDDTNLFYVWKEIKKQAQLVDFPDEFRGFDNDDVEEDRTNIMRKWKDSTIQGLQDSAPAALQQDEPSEDHPKEALESGSVETLEEEAAKQLDETSSNPVEDPEASLYYSPCSALSERNQNVFNNAFVLPKSTPKVPKVTRERPRPPAVATSDEYRAWYERIESDKQKEEQDRAEKKAARDAKKAAAATRRKEKSKAAPKRAKLII